VWPHTPDQSQQTPQAERIETAGGLQIERGETRLLESRAHLAAPVHARDAAGQAIARKAFQQLIQPLGVGLDGERRNEMKHAERLVARSGALSVRRVVPVSADQTVPPRIRNY